MSTAKPIPGPLALLDALEQPDRERVAGALLAVAAALLAPRAAPVRPDGAELLGEGDSVPRIFRSGRTLRDAIRAGDLVASRSGRAIVVRRSDLDRYLDEKKPKRGQPSAATPSDEAASAALRTAGLRVVR